MRAFITGTGRCGSVTCSRALAHARGLTVGHETHTNKTHHDRLAGDVANWTYPDDHLEVSPQLAWAVPILRARYPAARWVHLVRLDAEACARSLANWSNMAAFARYHFLNYHVDVDDLVTARAAYKITRALCEATLPADHFRLELEHAKAQWPACWEFLGLTGDLDASLAEWDTRHNQTLNCSSRL